MIVRESLYDIGISVLESDFFSECCVKTSMLYRNGEEDSFKHSGYHCGLRQSSTLRCQAISGPVLSTNEIQSSAVITRSSIVWYCMNGCMNSGRISIRGLINKRHPMPRPNRRAMGCFLVNIFKKSDRIITVPHCIMLSKVIGLLVILYHLSDRMKSFKMADDIIYWWVSARKM